MLHISVPIRIIHSQFFLDSPPLTCYTYEVVSRIYSLICKLTGKDKAEPMEKGISKYWTPEAENHYRKLLASSQTFAQRHLIMTIRDLLKYDGRTKEGKRTVAQGRLRIATATDADIEELAKLEAQMKDGGGSDSVPDKIEDYKKLRAQIRERGVKGGELECR